MIYLLISIAIVRKKKKKCVGGPDSESGAAWAEPQASM